MFYMLFGCHQNQEGPITKFCVGDLIQQTDSFSSSDLNRVVVTLQLSKSISRFGNQCHVRRIQTTEVKLKFIFLQSLTPKIKLSSE